jgi:chromosomal replication initiation ATPase DnaA
MTSRQIPLELPIHNAQTRDDLIVSNANAMAVSIIDSWPGWPGHLVVLTGPAGSGKSHMAAIWSKAANATIVTLRGLNAVNPPVAGNLVLEDAIAKDIDEKALFHVLNDIRSRNGHCLITSREKPHAWKIILPDLASRIKAAQLVELHEPDDELLHKVMFKLFADRQLQFEPGVIDYLLRRMERSLGVARTIVDRIDREALARNSRINRRIAASVLESVGRPID